MFKKLSTIFLLCLIPFSVKAQVAYSVVQVNEEYSFNLTKITSDNDYVCMPQVKRTKNGINWLTNRILDVSIDGNQLAYLSFRDNSTNIFIKDILKQGASVQRTNRQSVMDFSYSPDGNYICFSEANGKLNQIFQTSAKGGYVCRQITSGNQDYSPIYSSDMETIYFSRMDNNNISIWSFNIKNYFLSSYTRGFNPDPIPNNGGILCSRINGDGRGEIWSIDYNTGIEECIVSDPTKSFTTPSLSPDGKWILFVGSSVLMNGNAKYYNTDLYVCHLDGTNMVQLTYHAADDLSPVWSRDGKCIYFISQRGSSTATANVWRIDFQF